MSGEPSTSTLKRKSPNDAGPAAFKRPRNADSLPPLFHPIKIPPTVQAAPIRNVDPPSSILAKNYLFAVRTSADGINNASVSTSPTSSYEPSSARSVSVSSMTRESAPPLSASPPAPPPPPSASSISRASKTPHPDGQPRKRTPANASMLPSTRKLNENEILQWTQRNEQLRGEIVQLGGVPATVEVKPKHSKNETKLAQLRQEHALLEAQLGSLRAAPQPEPTMQMEQPELAPAFPHRPGEILLSRSRTLSQEREPAASSLQGQIDALQSQLEAAQSTSAASAGYMEDLLERVETLEPYKQRADDAEIEKAALQSRLSELEAQCRELTQERDTARNALQAQLDAPAPAADPGLVESLLQQIDILQVAEADNAAAKSKLSEIEALCRKFPFPFAHDPRTSESDTEVDVVKSVLGIVKNMVDALRREEAVLRGSLMDARRELDARVTEVSTLRGEVAKLQVEAAAPAPPPPSGANAELEAECERLRAELDARDTNAQETLHAVLSENETLQQELDALRAQAALPTTNADSEEMMQETLTQMLVLQEKEKELQEELRKQKEEVTRLGSENAKLRERAEAEVAALRQQQNQSLSSADLDKQQLREEAERLKEALRTAQAQFREKWMSSDQSGRELAEANAKIASLEKQLATANSKNTVLEMDKRKRLERLEASTRGHEDKIRSQQTLLANSEKLRSILENDNARLHQQLLVPPHPLGRTSVRSSRFRILDADFETMHLLGLVMHRGGGENLSAEEWGNVLRQLQHAARQGQDHVGRDVAAVAAEDWTETVLALQNYYRRWLLDYEPHVDLQLRQSLRVPVRQVAPTEWLDVLPEPPAPTKRSKPTPDDLPVPTPPRLSQAQIDVLWRVSVRKGRLFCTQCHVLGFQFDSALATPLEELAAHSEKYHRETCDMLAHSTANMDTVQIQAWFAAKAAAAGS